MLTHSKHGSRFSPFNEQLKVTLWSLTWIMMSLMCDGGFQHERDCVRETKLFVCGVYQTSSWIMDDSIGFTFVAATSVSTDRIRGRQITRRWWYGCINIGSIYRQQLFVCVKSFCHAGLCITGCLLHTAESSLRLRPSVLMEVLSLVFAGANFSRWSSFPLWNKLLVAESFYMYRFHMNKS